MTVIYFFVSTQQSGHSASETVTNSMSPLFLPYFAMIWFEISTQFCTILQFQWRDERYIADICVCGF